jgi:hypothetical protein
MPYQPNPSETVAADQVRGPNRAAQVPTAAALAPAVRTAFASVVAATLRFAAATTVAVAVAAVTRAAEAAPGREGGSEGGAAGRGRRGAAMVGGGNAAWPGAVSGAGAGGGGRGESRGAGGRTAAAGRDRSAAARPARRALRWAATPDQSASAERADHDASPAPSAGRRVGGGGGVGHEEGMLERPVVDVDLGWVGLSTPCGPRLSALTRRHRSPFKISPPSVDDFTWTDDVSAGGAR